ncbi:MAG: peroxiredoxin [Candidatus Nanopelagicales bacterium]
MAVDVGELAPDFELKNQFGETIKLSDFRGEKNVVLIFYPKAFTGLCTAELCAIRDDKQDFVSDDVVTFGISCDSDAALKVFAEQENYDYDLLSDYWPHGGVARSFGAFLEDKGFATRATFVIDKDGVVRWKVINGPGDTRSNDDYREALAAL